MQVEHHPFPKLTPQIISNKLRHLFNTPRINCGQKLLTPQPATQRKLFLNWAIDHQLKAHFQLMPVTTDGYPVNVSGQIKRLANSNKYLITNQNVNYVVAFDQIRSITNL